MELSVVIPVYNEVATIEQVVQRVLALPLSKELIIVDNCSTDGTRELIQQLDNPQIRVLLQEHNMMKGNSVRRGIAAAVGTYLVIQDGDLEYDPNDLLPMLEKCRQPNVLAVFGSRVTGARQRGQKLPTSSFSVGRELINRVFRLLYSSRLTDVATCYKMAATETFRSLNLRCNSFDLDFELAAKLSRLAKRRGMKVVEVPIAYFPRSVEEGKKIRWRDGLHALWTLWWCRFADLLPPAPLETEKRSGAS
jgi:dolichol-phosphate mannosyltransferase